MSMYLKLATIDSPTPCLSTFLYSSSFILLWEFPTSAPCFWKHRFVCSRGLEPVYTSLDTNPVTGCGQVCLTSVTNENWCLTLSIPNHKLPMRSLWTSSFRCWGPCWNVKSTLFYVQTTFLRTSKWQQQFGHPNDVTLDIEITKLLTSK